MIERLFKNWKTSLIGLLIIVGSMTLVFFEKASLTEAGLFMAGGISLFFLKDGKLLGGK